MSHDQPEIRLVEQTAAAMRRTTVEEATMTGTARAAPGDLFVHPATADWPLEWLVVQVVGGRAQVVPADTLSPFAASDVVVAAEDPSGPLVLRTAHAAWIGAPALRPENRSGRVVGTTLERVRFLVGRPPAVSSPSAPGDEELASWQGELAAARTALLAAAPAAGTPRLGDRLVSRRLLGLAATVLLVSSAVLLSQVGRLTRTVERLEHERQRDAAAIDRAEAARRGEATRSSQLEAALLAEREARAGQLAESHAPWPLVNVPFLWLTPTEVVRGDPPSLVLPEGGELVVLIVPLAEPARFSRYGAELARGTEVVWRSSDLVPTGVAELSLALPRSLLPPGEHSLRVSGLAPGKPQRIGTFRFLVAGPPRTASAAQRQSP